MSVQVPHPFPYQGSKRNIAHHILPYLPTDIDRLIEPFCGSAAISIAAAACGFAGKFALNDINSALMSLWVEILERPAQLTKEYERLWYEQQTDRKEYFSRVRAEFNATHEPHHLLYLLARIVKGSVRYSSDGQFNQAPDNRRSGMKPETMRRQILGVSELLADRTSLSAMDFRESIMTATTTDVVYLDPPYQGVSFARDHRYYRGLSYNELVDVLALMNLRGISYLVSYDGRTGEKHHGQSLPSDLELRHLEIYAGKSSQATFLGKHSETVESLYLSPALVNRLESGRSDSAVLAGGIQGRLHG
ncbi:MAG: DNA adenine methylase [Chloroflexota bacterium]|nr:DNA adenine methylase [Chloroflexota bacterium]MDE2684361.1 DNA adenine methylase [Chloroflexota bacterium]